MKHKLLFLNVAASLMLAINAISQNVVNFTYTGNVQTYTVPATGTYQLQVWGANGGNDGMVGGRGGYATGNINLTAGEIVRIYVGGQGGNCGNNNGGYNGGGNAGPSGCSGGGGGATDIRVGGTALANRRIVAGGGGGAGNGGQGPGGAGGGLVGITTSGGGGTQTAGGAGNGAGSLGQGGNRTGDGGGGGGGYYGGGAGFFDTGGGGGSSYIGGVTNGSTIAGNASMPNPAGGNMVGNFGNGYARITRLFSASITTNTTISCNGGNNGSLTAVASGGSSPFTYLWSNGSTSATITGLSAGTYTVTITDNANATAISSVTLTQPSALVTTTSGTNVSCNNGNNGSATVTASGGTPPYTYAWSGGGSSATKSNLIAGIYTVTVTDANSCVSTATRTVTQPTAISATTSGNHVSCNGGNNGTATVNASGGTPPYTYAWSGGGTNTTKSNLTAGTYTVTITDANGCVFTASRIVTQPTLLTASITNTSVSCNGGSNGSATVTAAGGTPPYTYAWNGGGTSTTKTGLAAGNNTVTVTDANGCTRTATTTITQPTVLNATTSGTNVTCNGGNNGTATVTPTGGTPPYTYAWSGGGTASTKSNLTAGTYTVTVTDANGCTVQKNRVITQPTALVATTTVLGNVFCNGGSNGSASASGSGGTPPYSYSWSGGGSLATKTGLSAGTFTVTITDNAGCTATSSGNITQPAAMALTMNGVNVVCNGGNNGSASVVVSGGAIPYSYSWTGGGNTNIKSNVTAGTYTVTVTDNNGCTNTGTQVITSPTAISAVLTDTNVACNGDSTGSSIANVSGGVAPYSYLWNTASTNPGINNLGAGMYTLTVTDNNGCTALFTTNITEPAGLSLALTINDVLCAGENTGEISSTVTGGIIPYLYQWSNAETSALNDSLIAGTYILSVTDANGCIASDSATVAQPDTLIANASIIQNVSCFGLGDGAANVSALGGNIPYTFTWSTNDTIDTLNGLDAGQYWVMVSDANGCMNTDTVEINQPDSLVLSISLLTNVICFGDANGEVSASVVGGTSPYIYNWSNGGVTANQNALSAGIYGLTVTDTNNCIAIDSIEVLGPSAALNVTINLIEEVICQGDNSGILEATAIGGWSNYTYTWSNGQNTALNTGLASSTYTVTVTDDLGCIKTAEQTLNYVFESPVVDLGPDTIVCSKTIYTLDAGNPGANYIWNTGDSTQVITTGDSGLYAVTVTNTDGCSTVDEIIIGLDECLGSEWINSANDEMLIFPNPSNGSFYIRTSSLRVNEGEMVIFDLSGKIIQQRRLAIESGDDIYVNTDFPKGIYIIQITIAQTRTVERLIIE